MAKWIQFTKERFKPLEYIPLIILFVGVNVLFAEKLSGLGFELWKVLLCLFLSLSFFFRMRLFDEIKDYEVDLVINPTRPLARGLISVAEVKKVIAILLGVEILLGLLLGARSALIYVSAVLYSLLMYKEFFIGNWLRPKLTTYALTHTIVVSILSLSIVSSFVDKASFNLLPISIFVLSHWFIFNLFEFARKTFSKNEERETVPSYSKIFGLSGAYLLSTSQVFLALWFLFTLRDLLTIGPMFALGALYVTSIIPCVLRPGNFKANLFRLSSTIYMGLHFIILFVLLWS